MPSRLTYDHVKSFCFQEGIQLLSKCYKNSYKQKLEVMCLKCNDVWRIKFNDIYNGHGCPKCAGVKKLNYNYVKNFCQQKSIDLISKEYKNSCKSKLVFSCTSCSHIWRTCFSKIQIGQGCPKCASKKRKETNLKRYGVEHPAQNREIALKAAKSCNNSYILYHWKTNEEIICTASYEKKVVEYFNKNKIDFEWQIPFSLPNGKTYFVDAFNKKDNIYIEIKGYFRKDAKEKWDWFHENYSNSELWDKDRLKKMKILGNSHITSKHYYHEGQVSQ